MAARPPRLLNSPFRITPFQSLKVALMKEARSDMQTPRRAAQALISVVLSWLLITPPAMMARPVDPPPTPTAVTLSASATPAAAQPGATVVTLTGSGFPAGHNHSGKRHGHLTTALRDGPARSAASVATVTGVTTLFGSTRRVTFQVPSTLSLAAPTAYLAGACKARSPEALLSPVPIPLP